MSNRLAFAGLKSLETALDLSVQQRARALFEAAKARTARGSGHELDKNIAGNSTAMASACLLLAKTELEGEATEDLEVYQRHAMVTKPQFRLLLSTLQTVLDLRSSAKAAFTPSRGSARKRKAEAQDIGEDPVTPSKSARSQQPSKIMTAGKDEPATPTRSTGRRSARTTASLRDLATASHQKARRAAVEQMSVDTSAAGSSRSSPRKAGTSSNNIPDTPTKRSEKGRDKATEAFDKAMIQKTPTKAKSALKNTPAQATVDYSKPFEAVKDDAHVPNREEAEEVLYETYWGDMLIRYRRKDELDARRQKTEGWRQSMLKSLRSCV